VVTLPIVLVVGLLLGGAGSSDGGAHPTAAGSVLPAVTVSAPPSTSAATVSTCAQVISALPLTLDHQDLRRTRSTPDSGQIQAWGDPSIVFRCGVSRPTDLVPGSSTEYILGGNRAGPYYDVTSANDAEIWTTVDRSIYIEVTVPTTYQGADVMPPVSRAIAKVLPAVCAVNDQEPNPDKLCTRRK
jgi:hypothetical protein